MQIIIIDYSVSGHRNKLYPKLIKENRNAPLVSEQQQRQASSSVRVEPWMYYLDMAQSQYGRQEIPLQFKIHASHRPAL